MWSGARVYFVKVQVGKNKKTSFDSSSDTFFTLYLYFFFLSYHKKYNSIK